ncbi:TPA: hypothetical protein N0F65_008161 [Lagenidium giganteum]|uniref:TBC1 domain family member 23 n=1 Tax=Lagenidium giganteum TaxID=4803 RepID=A0AAV2YQD2_9STRA|nr:TPA: hypothetical protein N0F65_008161 [Lagenidium giganteum]
MSEEQVPDSSVVERRAAALRRVLLRQKLRLWASKAKQERDDFAEELLQLFSSSTSSSAGENGTRLITRRPGVEEVKHCLLASLYPCLPPQCEMLRGEIWQVLLNVFKRNQHGVAAQEFDRMVARLSKLPRDPLLVAECTLVSQLLATTAEEQAQVQHNVEMLLVWFLTTKSIAYSSGMARVLAPFFLLHLPLPTIYDCFYQYCALFLPDFMNNESVYGSQIDTSANTQPTPDMYNPEVRRERQELVEQLLSYHDPQLAHVLTQWCPEEWSRPGALIPADFFLDNVYRVMPPTGFVYVIDQYLLTGDNHFGLFILVAALMHSRDELFQLRSSADVKQLIQSTFETTALQDPKQAQLLCMWAARLRVRTPKRYRCALSDQGDQRCATRRVMELAFKRQRSGSMELEDLGRKSDVDMSEWQRRESKSYAGKVFWYHTPTGKTQWEHPAETAQPAPALFALPVSVEEVAAQAMGEKTVAPADEPNDVHYFVVDCRALRSSEDLKSGRIPAAYTLDPSVFDSPELIAKSMEAFNPMKSRVHIVLVGHGVGIPPELVTTDELKTSVRDAVRHDIDSINRAALFFQKRGFRFVGVLDGGYSSWHAYMRDHAAYSLQELLGHVESECHYCRYDIMLRTGEDPFKKKKESESRFRRKKSAMPTVTNLPVNGGEGDPSIISTSNVTPAPSSGGRRSFTLSRNSITNMQKKFSEAKILSDVKMPDVKMLSDVKMPKLPQWGRRSSSSASQLSDNNKRTDSTASDAPSGADDRSSDGRASATDEPAEAEKSDPVAEEEAAPTQGSSDAIISPPRNRKKSFVGVFTIDYSDDDDDFDPAPEPLQAKGTDEIAPEAGAGVAPTTTA